jgi:predicted nucleotidyltransferase
MNTPMDLLDRNQLTEIVKETLGQDSRILAVYLHGSAAQGTMRPQSDVDLAVLLQPKTKMDSLARRETANQIAYRLGRDVDLGEISAANLVFAAEVLFKGQLLFSNDTDATASYTAALLGLYIQFNYDRREVLDAYRIG